MRRLVIGLKFFLKFSVEIIVVSVEFGIYI